MQESRDGAQEEAGGGGKEKEGGRGEKIAGGIEVLFRALALVIRSLFARNPSAAVTDAPEFLRYLLHTFISSALWCFFLFVFFNPADIFPPLFIYVSLLRFVRVCVCARVRLMCKSYI